jgi:hypothetical protein
VWRQAVLLVLCCRAAGWHCWSCGARPRGLKHVRFDARSTDRCSGARAVFSWCGWRLVPSLCWQIVGPCGAGWTPASIRTVVVVDSPSLTMRQESSLLAAFNSVCHCPTRPRGTEGRAKEKSLLRTDDSDACGCHPLLEAIVMASTAISLPRA